MWKLIEKARALPEAKKRTAALSTAAILTILIVLVYISLIQIT